MNTKTTKQEGEQQLPRKYADSDRGTATTSTETTTTTTTTTSSEDGESSDSGSGILAALHVTTENQNASMSTDANENDALLTTTSTKGANNLMNNPSIQALLMQQVELERNIRLIQHKSAFRSQQIQQGTIGSNITNPMLMGMGTSGYESDSRGIPTLPPHSTSSFGTIQGNTTIPISSYPYPARSNINDSQIESLPSQGDLRQTISPMPQRIPPQEFSSTSITTGTRTTPRSHIVQHQEYTDNSTMLRPIFPTYPNAIAGSRREASRQHAPEPLLPTSIIQGLSNLNENTTSQPQQQEGGIFETLSNNDFERNKATSPTFGAWSTASAQVFSSLAVSAAEEKAAKESKSNESRKPKRPLSAYNIFFKEERQRILEELPESEVSKKEPTRARRRKKPHGKIDFQSLAKTVGKRWQSLPPEGVRHYKEKANQDLARYRQEMEIYLREKK